MGYTFKKDEKLCSKTHIDSLFANGSSDLVYPFRILAMEIDSMEEPHVQVLISVSKRNFKSAVKRNAIKRRIREAYRRNKHMILSAYDNNSDKRLLIAFIYTAKTIVESSYMEQKLILILQRLTDKDVKINR
ncbi:MAG: ribonuclease P protein component [Lentimicrobiaceae bacterium]|nr:ribonuclease P protein component [Lentimicrobiaceae bacterium]MDG1901552.1 ribonuclease P protein component [Bacteroidales bacterium]MDG2081601.1 ribonuclease P protein component [Bacteroidales bacterium]